VYDDSSEWHTVSSSVGTAERVEDLKEDESVAERERLRAQHNGEDVGWSSLANEEALQAPPDTTDEQLMRYLKVNYAPDALAKLLCINLGNTQVTDAAATALAKGCPGLQVIHLDNTQVTDAAVTALAKGCPGLQSISLDNTQVTDTTTTALAKGCPGLRAIDLTNTQVTPSLAKFWYNTTTAEYKQHPRYGGTIKDFRWQLNRITKKKKKGKGKKKRR
jgi:hypothetical protein